MTKLKFSYDHVKPCIIFFMLAVPDCLCAFINISYGLLLL